MTSPIVLSSRLDRAIEALTNDQRQLDEDGVFAGVSREALHAVLAEVDYLRADKARLEALVAQLMGLISPKGAPND